MNIYLRYFNDECVVKSLDEALNFLKTIGEIQVDETLAEDMRQYLESDIPYPKRYKVRNRVYFIVIKTDAESLEQFKENGKQAPVTEPTENHAHLYQEETGWYEGTIAFKRVIQNPETGKCQYEDTTFCAQVKANSGMDCYNRIVEHLRNRMDIDERSQFPAARGKNFTVKYIGLTL